MTSRQRLLAALRRETPDRVPYCKVGVSGQVLHVEAEVDRLLRQVAPGGGYVLSSGNSLAS